MKYYAYGSHDAKKHHVHVSDTGRMIKVNNEDNSTMELYGPVEQLTDNPNWKEVSAADAGVGGTAKSSKKSDD